MTDAAVNSRLRTLVEQCWPHGRVVGIAPLEGDASTRAYARLRLEGPSGTPATAMAMLMQDSSVAISSEELGSSTAQGADELPFSNVARFLARRTDALPLIYATSQDRKAMLLEDVGDCSLWDACAAQPAGCEALVARALQLLADLQRQALDDGSGCYLFQRAFDARLFAWEFEHFLEFGLEHPPASLVQRAHSELNELALRLAEYPRVFCHRDYHAWNLHVQEERIRILDFQDALLGPALYDVASLLTDRSTPELIDADMEQRLLDGFVNAADAAHGLDSTQAKVSYRLCVLQRSLKILGRFNYLAEKKAKPGYLRFLPSTAATARRVAEGLSEGIGATRLLLAKHLRGLP